MSDFEHYPDSGRLIAAKVKKSQKSPDYWGEIAIDVKNMANVRVDDNGLHIFKLSGWKKTSKAGSTYLSFAIDRREREPEVKQEQDDEDVPF